MNAGKLGALKEARMLRPEESLCAEIVEQAIRDAQLSDKQCEKRTVWNNRASALSFLVNQNHAAFEILDIDLENLQEMGLSILRKNPVSVVWWRNYKEIIDEK